MSAWLDRVATINTILPEGVRPGVLRKYHVSVLLLLTVALHLWLLMILHVYVLLLSYEGVKNARLFSLLLLLLVTLLEVLLKLGCLLLLVHHVQSLIFLS